LNDRFPDLIRFLKGSISMKPPQLSEEMLLLDLRTINPTRFAALRALASIAFSVTLTYNKRYSPPVKNPVPPTQTSVR
jgi:hypothetical protein